MANFTVEINRGQSDAVVLSTDKTSPSGLAFTWVFDRANGNMVEDDTPFPSEPAYLRSLLLKMLNGWRNTQLKDGVSDAYKEADESTRLSVRTTLGL